jgi:hypothetical protein
MAKSLVTPLERKVNDLKDGLCILSYIQNKVIKCKISEEPCIVTSNPEECPAIKDKDNMRKMVYGL